MKKALMVLTIMALVILIVAAITKGTISLPYPWKLLPTVTGIQVVAFLGIFYLIAIRTRKIGGPYFRGQIMAHCGHYYPDVVLLGDKLEPGSMKRIRVLHCVFCGEYSIPLALEVPLSLTMNPIPTDEWREQTRQDLQEADSRRRAAELKARTA